MFIYRYNDDDRLIGFTRDAGKNGSIDTSASYAYDSAGQRTRSVVTSGSVSTTTSWLYEGLTLLRAQSASQGATTTVEYANDSTGRPFGAWVSTPAREGAVWVWLVTDQRGDVLELLASDGTPISYRAYSAYGETLAFASRAGGGLTEQQSAAVDAAISLRYAGYTHDTESGLYYCSQRYYDPVTCQWITKDPARADGEESAYQYCGGDPVGAVDPSGLAKFQLMGSSLTKKDRVNAKRYALDIPFVALAWGQAIEYQALYYPETFKGDWYGGDGHTANAFKHAAWNALMVSHFVQKRLMTPGSARKRAATWATGHEYASKEALKKKSKYKRFLRKMDLHNNLQGRIIGEENWFAPDLFVAQKVKRAVSSGRMRYVKKGRDGEWQLYRTNQ